MEQFITQDGITYRIVDDILRGWTGDSPFTRPVYDSGSGTIIESWTQADQDALDEETAQAEVGVILDRQQEDGDAFYKRIRNLVRRKRNQDVINATQFQNIKDILEPALRPLILGDWLTAQNNINAITPPAGELLVLYNFVKDGIDDYITVNSIQT